MCNIGILINALDGRTYQSDITAISPKERLSCIYARGKSIDLLKWINDNYRLLDSTKRKSEPCLLIMQQYFFQQTSAIKMYKDRAEKEGISGSETARNCSSDELSKQLDMAIEVFPGLQGNEPPFFLTSTSLAWQGDIYRVEQGRNTSCKSEP